MVIDGKTLRAPGGVGSKILACRDSRACGAAAPRGPSRSREEDEHIAGQRLLYRVAPPWDTDGRVVAVAAELGCVESHARDEQLELGPEARDVRE
eukprot:scaffold31857_cov57-Phaeocystis_antarctica.AAC.2